MAQPLEYLSALKLIGAPLMPEGQHALVRRGQILWTGPLGSPIEDADFDTVLLNPADLARLAPKIAPEK